MSEEEYATTTPDTYERSERHLTLRSPDLCSWYWASLNFCSSVAHGIKSVTVFEADLSRRYETCILTSSSSLYLRASLAYFSARSGSAARLRLLSLG